jgi:DNA gyrase subunit A
MLVTGRPRDPLPTTEIRVFKGRDSTGVRGIRLARRPRGVDGGHPPLRGDPEERAAYLKQRRLMAGRDR